MAIAAIPSQSFISEEGCHWFDVGFSPDVFMIEVVLLGLASCQYERSHPYVITGLTMVL